jgi:lysophospholipase L1-like esterase
MSPIARIGAAVAATALALAAATAPAYAAPEVSPTQYAALGDSFSAGVGTGSPTDPACFRSPEGYPALIADASDWELEYLACSGATVAQVAGQVQEMAPDTDVVTLTAGGNDAGFSAVLGACATGNEAQCALAIHSYDTRVLQGPLPGALDDLYQAVQAKAPAATVVVVGYPRLLDYRDCLRTPDGLHISIGESALINAYTDRLNAVIKTRAETSGLKFADATAAFQGHAACAPRPWVNGFLAPPRTGESFHPNDAGNVGYARLVSRQIGVTGPVTGATADIR